MKTPLSVIENGNLELNKIIKDTLKTVLPALEQFKGKKICTVVSNLMKSAESLKTLLPTKKRADGSEYSIAFIRCSAACFSASAGATCYIPLFQDQTF